MTTAFLTDVVIRYHAADLIAYLAANAPDRLNAADPETGLAAGQFVVGLTRSDMQTATVEGVTWQWQFARIEETDRTIWEAVAADPVSTVEILGQAPYDPGNLLAVYAVIEAAGGAAWDALQALTFFERDVTDEAGNVTGTTTGHARPTYM